MPTGTGNGKRARLFTKLNLMSARIRVCCVVFALFFNTLQNVKKY